MNLIPPPVRSSLGKKYLMAVTGLLLIGFVVAHMAGNLLIFAGQDVLNSYAQALKAKPALLWVARLGLLSIFVIHLSLAFSLQLENKRARPVRYHHEDTIQASWASRNMLITGLAILAFLLYHLSHYTLGWVKTADLQVTNSGILEINGKNYLDLAEIREGKSYQANTQIYLSNPKTRADMDVRHDVYSMVVDGFRTWWVSLTYLAAMLFLGLHLWHGGSSFLQTLGLNAFRYAGLVRWVGPILAVVLVTGNSAIVFAVWLGLVK
ncbi:MAG: succinate dehydrogenase cytochrome b subunit [Gemmataceae bacterium]